MQCSMQVFCLQGCLLSTLERVSGHHWCASLRLAGALTEVAAPRDSRKTVLLRDATLATSSSKFSQKLLLCSHFWPRYKYKDK